MSKPERRPRRFSPNTDDVLRKMLSTPPKPRSASTKKKPEKPAKK